MDHDYILVENLRNKLHVQNAVLQQMTSGASMYCTLHICVCVCARIVVADTFKMSTIRRVKQFREQGAHKADSWVITGSVWQCVVESGGTIRGGRRPKTGPQRPK